MTDCKDKCWCYQFSEEMKQKKWFEYWANITDRQIKELQSAIECYQERISKLERYMEIEDRITACDVLARLTVLETSVDFEKAKELIFQGAQTHATILKIQSEIKSLTEMYKNISIGVAGFQDNHIKHSDHDERITDIENMSIEKRLLKLEEMQKNMLSAPNIIWSKYNKTPHRCPVCDGHGNPDITDSTARGPRLHMIENDPCNSCKGKGIVWG